MELFYFSRTGGVNPFSATYVVSGVVEAENLDAAKAAVDEAFRTSKRTDRHDSFRFTNLRETERSPSSLVAITIAGA
jgi:hypothetical protein